MAERNRDETFMINAAGDANVLIAVTAIKKQARKVCCDQFLATLFLKWRTTDNTTSSRRS